MVSSLGSSMFKGAIWSTIERLSVQLVQFIIGIIISRILSPSEYGTIGLLAVFIAFFTVLIDSGFTKALIQKQNRTETDLSTIFFFNILISVVCYIVLWIAAPFIARFYAAPILTSLTRFLSFSMILNAFFAIPLTILTIRIDFKSIAKINLISIILSGGIGIVSAYKGFGVWSLAFQIVGRSVFTIILMWLKIKWKPQFVFSIQALKTMYGFGSKYVLSALLSMVVNNISALFIAKLINAKELGYYTRGTQFADVVFGTFNSVLDSVLLPGLSTIQNEKENLVGMTRFVIKSTALISTPVLIGLATIANPLVSTLLTDKWLPAVPIMQIICIARLITIIAGININILYVLGRTDLTLKQDYVKIIVRITLLMISFKFGIFYIALAELSSTIIHFFINCYSPGKILEYGAVKQIKDLMPIFLISMLMVISMYATMVVIDKNIIKILVAPVIGAMVYLSALYVFRIKEFFILLNKVKLLIKVPNTNLT
ncbi:lipopolysaccharide biosynthesis protein [Mucilaginibacter corticis]|uniref:Lipopolysaccharide biosynthesis protein n=1 Tax=Mucilaginibacter corticis TaxID=2597670 RepID=A0A556MT34_9SPHI|nr:lipopolysaccharide biosynthesis protein [Mucilaginibacter corticis]TSJ43076.1 lipopolysaccharide biosynthesis protein [Mucilaginibacter corticis]